MPEIYEKGQVVIPKCFRDLFRLFPGTSANFRVEHGKLTIESDEEIREEFRRLCTQAADTDEETGKAIKEMRKKRLEGFLNVP